MYIHVMKAAKKKTERITFRLTKKLARRLAAAAKDEGVKPSVLIRQALESLLQRAA